MAKYTASPLGLIDNTETIGSGNTFDNIFSGWKNNNTKHFLRKSNKKYSGILSTSPHSQDVYDISTTNIIEKLREFEHLKLSYADFAYNKEFGVYPNNRLIVCRRYPTGVVDDLYSVTDGNKPLSTVVGYVKDEDFLTFKVSEQWTNAEVSFVELLNEIGKDFSFNLGGGLGSILARGENAIPLPGASLLFQRQIMAKLGLFGDGTTYNKETGKFENGGETVEVPPVPQGDPNLIKEARRRKLIDENDAGSGLSCKISVDFTVVYEQKFINENDPTLIYASILHNLLNMGTSKASFYLGKQTDKDEKILGLLNDLTSKPLEVITKFIKSIIETLKGATENLKKLLEGAKDDPLGAIDSVVSSITDAKDTIINFIKEKYKIKFVSIIQALTGGPSTPWHVTIGNPLRPIFCSGDMECTGVNIKLGPQLSFNDLPTYIEAKITLTSARNLGLQEIFAKLNTGGIRVVESKNGTTPSDHDYSISISDDFNSGAYNQINNTE